MGIRLEAAVVRSFPERLQRHALGREHDRFARLTRLSHRYGQAGIIEHRQMDRRWLFDGFHRDSIQTVRRPNERYSGDPSRPLDLAGISQFTAREAAYHYRWQHCLRTYRIECRLCGLCLALLQKGLRGDESLVRAFAAAFVRPRWGQQDWRGFFDAPYGRTNVPRSDISSALCKGFCLIPVYYCRGRADRGPTRLGTFGCFDRDRKLYPSLADYFARARKWARGWCSPLFAPLETRLSVCLSRGAPYRNCSSRRA